MKIKELYRKETKYVSLYNLNNSIGLARKI